MRMRFGVLLLMGLMVLVPARAAEAPSKPKPAESNEQGQAQFRKQVAEHIAQPKFAAAMWGVKIVSLDSGRTLFETNANKLLKPASNAKVFTGALALDVFGPDRKSVV